MNTDSLAQVQRRLWRLIAWPEGVRAALDQERDGEVSEERDGERSEAAAPLASIVKSDARLAAEDRLDVYANAYFYRIHDVLAEDFPSLVALFGEDGFHDLVTSYLAVFPSRHPSLRHIGGRLAEFVDEHPAGESFRQRFAFAGDLARYEAATEDVFDAADATPATRDDLAAVAPEDWAGLPLRLVPSVRILRLGWPVHEVRHAVRDGQPIPTLGDAPVPLALCLWREDERVVSREVAPDECSALEAASRGVSFGALCEQIANDRGENEAPLQAAGWLAGWIDAGLVLALEPTA